MSAIKDITELITDLQEKISDRKTHDALHPIKEKLLDVERSQFELEKSHFETVQAHQAELVQLHKNCEQEKDRFRAKIFELESQITELKGKDGDPPASIGFF